MTIGKSEFGWENSVNETKSDGEREENLDDNNVEHIFLENRLLLIYFFNFIKENKNKSNFQLINKISMRVKNTKITNTLNS